MEEVVRVDVLEPALVVDCCVWCAGPHGVSLRVETSRLHETIEVGIEAARKVAESKMRIMGAQWETCVFPLLEDSVDLLIFFLRAQFAEKDYVSRCTGRVRASASCAQRVRVRCGRVRAACEHPLDDIPQLRGEPVEVGRRARVSWVHLRVGEADVVTEHVHVWIHAWRPAPRPRELEVSQTAVDAWRREKEEA